MSNNAEESVKTFRNLFTRVVPDKRNRISKEIDDKEIEEYIDKTWEESEKLNKKAGRIINQTAKIFLFALILFSANKVFSFSILNPPYNQSDPNFNKLAMRVYNSGSPYTYTSGA